MLNEVGLGLTKASLLLNFAGFNFEDFPDVEINAKIKLILKGNIILLKKKTLMETGHGISTFLGHNCTKI